MKHFHNNSNQSSRGPAEPHRGLTDQQLDDALLMADPPGISRRRKRRLKQHLANALGQNRPSLTLRANCARAAIGVAAVIMLTSLGEDATVVKQSEPDAPGAQPHH